MKKVGIITMYDNNNFGNRLQNYAVQESLRKLNTETISIKYERDYETKAKHKIKNIIRYFKWFVIKKHKYNKLNFFKKFNKNLNITNKMYNCKNIKNIDESNIDYYVVGSDQVWNPNFGRLTDIELLEFSDKPKMAFSASFGISDLPDEYKDKTKSSLSKFKAISVREDAGKKIIDELGIDKEVEVLVDPTMLLSAEEWDKVSNKPENIKDGEKYILNYFLGKLPDEWDKEIKRIAKENDCKIINILDENDPYFVSGPSEFLYLEKNAFLICTDSFHSCVFALIYKRPFVVFDREDNLVKMNSRIDTFLNTFKLNDRRFNGTILEENLDNNYEEAYEVLSKEKLKSIEFLKKALNLNGENYNEN